ncbi:PREDICTED: uncharacterized protein LOC106102316 [Papilio polytes]|uniref:uncharacterized protein LOC106102316 n=1 Tax=Papilio polytes TaxID=76194 RepID=UPI00067682CA|nr:PREDICTED: uncharacterized protein LOC106102316 [Papilio polytes]
MSLVVLKALLLLLATAVAEDEPASIINEISKKFGSTMLYCVQLLYPNTGYFKDVLDFWNHDLNVTGHIYLGCLAACSMFKLQLRNRDGSLNDTNVNNFLRDNGAGIYVA